MTTPDLRIIDAHAHQWAPFDDPAQLGRFLERTPELHWIIFASDLQGGYYPDAQEVAESNRNTLRKISRFPDRVKGWCYVSPRWDSAIYELERGIEAGLLGVKLWVATRCNDPVTFPVVEKAIEMNVPLLVHTWRKRGGNLAEESLPTDMADLSRRYPEARFLMAHFGGDWEFGLRAIRHCPNVWADFAGTINEYGAYELALAELGEDRIVFGTDLPADFQGNLGRVLQGGWSQATLDKILYRNFEALTRQQLIR